MATSNKIPDLSLALVTRGRESRSDSIRHFATQDMAMLRRLASGYDPPVTVSKLVEEIVSVWCAHKRHAARGCWEGAALPSLGASSLAACEMEGGAE